MKTLAAFELFAFICSALIAQESHAPMTNADVIAMTKSGIAEQTVVLAIGREPASFDTSPQALIELKKTGVSDAILNAMLTARKYSGQHLAEAPTEPPVKKTETVPASKESFQVPGSALDSGSGLRVKVIQEQSVP